MIHRNLLVGSFVPHDIIIDEKIGLEGSVAQAMQSYYEWDGNVNVNFLKQLMVLNTEGVREVMADKLSFLGRGRNNRAVNNGPTELKSATFSVVPPITRLTGPHQFKVVHIKGAEIVEVHTLETVSTSQFNTDLYSLDEFYREVIAFLSEYGVTGIEEAFDSADNRSALDIISQRLAVNGYGINDNSLWVRIRDAVDGALPYAPFGVPTGLKNVKAIDEAALRQLDRIFKKVNDTEEDAEDVVDFIEQLAIYSKSGKVDPANFREKMKDAEARTVFLSGVTTEAQRVAARMNLMRMIRSAGSKYSALQTHAYGEIEADGGVVPIGTEFSYVRM